jgi:hypothetical protein
VTTVAVAAAGAFLDSVLTRPPIDPQRLRERALS